MNFNCECGMAGFYTFLVNGVEVFTAPSKNLITDSGWSRFLSSGSIPTSSMQVMLGTGNTPPTTADTALVAQVAQHTGPTLSTTSGTDATGAFNAHRMTHTFAQGAVVGNIAEVGWKAASTDSALFSRSLIVDGLGNPTTLVLTAIDQLTVNYDLRYYVNNTLTSTGVISIGGVSTTWTLRPSAVQGIASFSGISGLNTPSMSLGGYNSLVTLGGPGSAPTGASLDYNATKSVTVTVSVPTNTVTYQFDTISTGEANLFGGIGALVFGLGNPSILINGIKVGFSPAINKTSTKTLDVTFSITFTRY